jgi:hypothetical protein
LKQGQRHRIPTVSQVVSRGAAICDPAGADVAVTALVESFEDDERPTTAVDDLAGELGSTVGGVDPEGDSPAAAVAAAVAAWLGQDLGEHDDHERVIREAVRLGFADSVPADVEAWLEGQGITI